MARDRLSFDWDNRKNLANKRKHKVSFEEAQTVFYDEEALLRDDPDHSDDEDRFILLGVSSASDSGRLPLLQERGPSHSDHLCS